MIGLAKIETGDVLEVEIGDVEELEAERLVGIEAVGIEVGIRTKAAIVKDGIEITIEKMSIELPVIAKCMLDKREDTIVDTRQIMTGSKTAPETQGVGPM